MTEKERSEFLANPQLLWGRVIELENENRQLFTQLSKAFAYKGDFHREVFKRWLCTLAAGCTFGVLLCEFSLADASFFIKLAAVVLCGVSAFIPSAICSALCDAIITHVETPIFAQRSLWISALAVVIIAMLFVIL